MLRITLNGQPRDLELEAPSPVEAMLDALGITQRRGVAVAIDDAVVPKSTWADHLVRDGARVEVIQATQGG